MKFIIVLLTCISCITLVGTDAAFAKEKVRLAYAGMETPDHLIYEILAATVSQASEVQSKKKLADWVFSEINLEFDADQGGWFLPEKNRKHSRGDANKLIKRLLDDTKLMKNLNKSSHKRLVCDPQFSGQEELYKSYSAQDDASHGIAKRCFEDSTVYLGNALDDSLRVWIERMKPGYQGEWYNYDVVWAGKESYLDQVHQSTCNSISEEES